MAEKSKQEKIKATKKTMTIVGIVAIACVGLAIVAVVVLSQVTKGGFGKSNIEKELGVIEIDGQKYVPKQNIETYLFIGVDKDGEVEKIDEFGDAGQSDVLMLMVRDISTGTFKMLSINRNTMAEVDDIDVEGNNYGTSVIQLCIAHARGDGMEMSCENTVAAVSRFLKGQKIDGYAAVNMSAIGVINEQVGGVTVTIEDDFSNVDPSLKIGETIKLSNAQAETFVRGRMSVADGSNENRIHRQNVYVDALKPLFEQKCAENNSFPLEVYEALGPYMVTNINSQKFSKLALMVVQDKADGRVEITGEKAVGEDGTAEFYPDEKSVQEVVLELFYKPYN